MSLVSQSVSLLVVLLVAWNGDYCQAQSEESSPSRLNHIMGQVAKIGMEATTIDWHPPQPCWMGIVGDIRESCGTMITMSCLESAPTAELTSCLQKEIVSNGGNLWKLATRLMPHRPRPQQQSDESSSE